MQNTYFRDGATTNNIPSNKTPTTADIYAAIQQAHALLTSVRKLRYRTSVYAPMEPVVFITKSYEMVIMHPSILTSFMARFEMSESQLAFLGMSPASDEEWQEWAKEAAAQMSEKTVKREIYDGWVKQLEQKSTASTQ